MYSASFLLILRPVATEHEAPACLTPSNCSTMSSVLRSLTNGLQKWMPTIRLEPFPAMRRLSLARSPKFRSSSSGPAMPRSIPEAWRVLQYEIGLPPVAAAVREANRKWAGFDPASGRLSDVRLCGPDRRLPRLAR